MVSAGFLRLLTLRQVNSYRNKPLSSRRHRFARIGSPWEAFLPFLARWSGTFVYLFLFLLSASAQLLPHQIGGRVMDPSGADVRGADVVLRSGSVVLRAVTNDNGEFSFDKVPGHSGILSVTAPGFALKQVPWNADAGAVRVTLRPAIAAETVVVTANRSHSRLDETPTSVVVLGREDLASTAALSTDDILRQVPGFSLFRRTTSRTANPTSQGVSLRGLGASGASRALVLADGFPVNDAFGGWVYWDRVPRENIDHVEVASGGASHLYGSDALGGVINVFRKPLDADALSLELAYGNENTPDLSLAGSKQLGQWALGVDSDLFRSDGYFAVPPQFRGAVDTPVNSQHGTGEVTLQRKLTAGNIFARASLLGESRHNGTPLQTNSTTIREIDLGSDWQLKELGNFALRAYAGNENFYQTFSSIAPDRATETLVRIQRVPAQRVGFSGQWTKPAGTRQNLLAGIEQWDVHGQTNELIASSGAISRAGGREVNWAGYGEDIIRVTPSWFLTLSGRVDHWLNFSAFSTGKLLPDRRETFFSPRASLLYKVTNNVSLTASGYRSFRAPTLNELYRSFRLGNILTVANADLRAERLTGAEAGAIITGFDRRLMIRGNFFWADLTRPVANVTVSQTPTLITRERENLGRTRSRGIEVEATAQLNKAMVLSGGYQYVDATVLQGVPTLIGKWIPQVPHNQFNGQIRYTSRFLMAGLQARYVGDQYDDDLNAFLLRRYFTMDAMLSRTIRPGVEVFAAAENLLNQRYDVGRTPVLTVGPPVFARVGLKLQFGAR